MRQFDSISEKRIPLHGFSMDHGFSLFSITVTKFHRLNNLQRKKICSLRTALEVQKVW